MTNILKELKELDAKATSAPWSQSHRADIGGYYTQIYCQKGETIATMSWYKKDKGGGVTGTFREDNAKLIADTRNALPELIRVIELAEEALSQVNDKSHFVPAIVQEAISEIRKLKGE